jgi:hypothetical protein
MDDLPLFALLAAAALGVVATLLILRRQQSEAADATRENPFAVSTEGMKRCPNCGFGNLVTDATCLSCGKHLPG